MVQLSLVESLSDEKALQNILTFYACLLTKAGFNNPFKRKSMDSNFESPTININDLATLGVAFFCPSAVSATTRKILDTISSLKFPDSAFLYLLSS